jgi:hypothetical protein
MAPWRGPFSRRLHIVMMAMLYDHGTIVMMAMIHDHGTIVMMPMITMPSMVAMHAMMLDDDRFGACDRWGGDRNGSERGNDITKLLHAILLG